MTFAKFMSGTVGRLLRFVAGVAALAVGVALSGRVGVALGLFGVVAMAAGTFNFCLLGPALGAPLRGARAK